MLLVLNNTNAQTTYKWEFATATATSGSNANLTVDTFKQGNNNGTVVPRVSGSVSSGYTGASGTFNFGLAARTGVFSSVNSAYAELTITPASGYTVQVTGLTFGRRCTSTGPQRYVVKTSKDNYVDSLAADTIANNSAWALESPTVTSVTSAAGTALTIRIYGYNGTGTAAAGTANWRLDDISLTVVVASAETAPAAPTSGGNQTACTGGSIPNLSASATNGAVVDWYATASGGTALSSGSNSFATGQTAAGTYTYYAESRNNPGTLKSASRTAVSLTITQSVTASVAASVDDNTPAPGQNITFTATPTNGGANPPYQWYKNNGAISGATNATYSTNSNYATGDSFYVTMSTTASCATPTTVTSGNVYITIDNSACTGAPLTNAVASSTNVCNGGSSSVSLTGLGGQTGYTYQWQSSSNNSSYSDISGETNATLALTNIATTMWYRCNVTCSNTSQTTASNSVQINVTANETPTVSIGSSQSPACSGANVTFTATPTFGGTTPTYAWYKNSILVSGVTGATYSSTSFLNGDQIYAQLTSNYTCLSTSTATSNTVTQNITSSVAASVSITSSANPACAGASVTFTATPVNGGTPTYQWYNGATPISGETNSFYTSTSLTNNSSISVVMVSNATCVTGSPATSNTIVQGITANVTPTMTIASNNNPVCISGNARFNINPTNGGTTPTYAWYLNGALVIDSTNSTFTLSPVTDGDSVYATMISSASCVTTSNATSNVIHESIVSQATPTVTISASPGTSIFDGTNVTFTATPTFGGTAPTYQWKLNGANVTTGSTYSSSLFANGDVITCVMTSNYTCLTTNTATSNTATITILGNSPFTPGNLVVYRSGDSVNALTTNANPIFLAEYTTTGQFVQAKRISKNSSTAKSIFTSGSSTSEGMMTLNADGTNLVVPGYYTTLGTASITTSTSATINRVVALIDMNQNEDTTTRLSDWASGGSPRGATANGNSIYVTGSTNSIRYATKGSTTSTQLTTSLTNFRNVGIFNSQLYASDNSGTTYKLSSIGTGLPTTSGQTMTNIPGFPTASTSQPYGFFFLDMSNSVAGLDVVYVADDVANTITKYSLVSGTWTSNGTITATTVKGLTISRSGSTVNIYGTAVVTTPAGTYIYTYTDASGYNGSISGTATKLVDRTGVTLVAFRGIAFTPTMFTTQPSSSTVCVGSTASFTIAMATGTSSSIYSYQWQGSTNGTNWSDIIDNSVYSNATTPSLTVSNPTGLNGYQYRCVVTYMGVTTMTSNAATLTVPQTYTPSVLISTDNTTICSADATLFTATPTDGGSLPTYVWKKNGNSVGTGSTISFTAGSLTSGDNITCEMTANNTCQTQSTVISNTLTMTVNASPAVPSVYSKYGSNTTAATICTIGTGLDLYPSPVGGTWSSSNANIVTVANSSASSSGVITAVSNGTANAIYTLTSANGCSATKSVSITVAQQTAPSSITGLGTLCVGGTTTYSSTPVGGVWSMGGRGTINPVTGFVSVSSAGSSSIIYTTTNVSGCSAFITKSITINSLPVTPTIAYAPGTVGITTTGGVCKGKTFNVVGSPVNGYTTSWSLTNSNGSSATITPIVIPVVGAQIQSGSTNGRISVQYSIEDNNHCINSRTTSVNIVSCGSKETKAAISTNNSFLMYPNPAKGTLKIKLDNLVGQGTLRITNLVGKEVKIQAMSLGNNNIDINNLSKGVYLVSLVTTNGKATQKLVIE